MPIRNTHKIGDYLAVDDESGLTHYASEMTKDWDGQWRHKDNLDGRHPQLDVAKAVKRDPVALADIRPRVYPTLVTCAFDNPFIGNTTIFSQSPRERFAGIGEMSVDCSCNCVFVVR